MRETGIRIQGVLAQMLDKIIKRIPDAIAALALLLVFLMIAWLVRRALAAALARANSNRDAAAMLTRVVYWLLVTIGLFEALSQLQVNLEALGISVGLLGFAIGFALKDVLSNFLSGILILLTRPFVLGDQIRIKEYEGTIEAIEMRGTILQTYDGRRVIIPNSDVYTNPVTNHTAYQHRRSSLFVTVGYGSDLAQVETVVRAALKTVEGVSEEPAPDVLVKELADFGIKFEVRIWTAPRQWDILTINSAATKAVFLALEASGIEMPFPTQIVIQKPAAP